MTRRYVKGRSAQAVARAALSDLQTLAFGCGSKPCGARLCEGCSLRLVMHASRALAEIANEPTEEPPR